MYEDEEYMLNRAKRLLEDENLKAAIKSLHQLTLMVESLSEYEKEL